MLAVLHLRLSTIRCRTCRSSARWETRARSEVTEFGQADLYSGRGRGGETILGFAQRTDSLVD